MAPGRIADRLLARSARTASAGAVPALAVLALALAGCGGGSSSEEGSTAASTPGAGAAGATDEAPARAERGKGDGAAATQDERPAAQHGRHGPPVPMPSGKREPKITPAQRRRAAVANIVLESPSSPRPAAHGTSALSAEYTCDGAGSSPALRWRGVPAGTEELALFAMNVKPVRGRLFFDWAVAGLGPDLEGIEAGSLPAGAVVGRNSFGRVGYEVCPAGAGETYVFALFALPKKLSPERGFDPLALRKEVAGVSRSAGLLGLSYARG